MARTVKLSEWEENRGNWTPKKRATYTDRTRSCLTCNGYGMVSFGFIEDEEDDKLYLDDSEFCPDCDGKGERS
jgi:DnaJ-class molecular chaperone